MAKSIRSKRKRKLRAARREQLKPRVKAALEKVLGLNDKEMIVETEGGEEDKGKEETQEELQEDTTIDTTATEITEDVAMKPEDGAQKKLGKKALKKIDKKKNVKRLANKKRKNQKIFKW